MHSFQRFALLLAMGLSAMQPLLAQSSAQSTAPASSSSTPSAAEARAQAQLQQAAAQSGESTVQARIRLRREQRRATAIHDAYDHKYDAYLGMGYMRFTPGTNLQRLTFYAWNTDVTRYRSERFGLDLDARGNFGTAYVGLNKYNLTRPAISQFDVMAGPVYRFYLHPKYDVAVRALGGVALGNFSGDTNHLGSVALGMWPDGTTFAASASLVGEYNITPAVAFRLAPEYFFTGFGYGSQLQASRGFTIGFAYRFGKQ